MESARLITCLESDYLRMREVVQGRYDARVPTCPEWTVADLTRHVGQVYLHKVELMRHGTEPETWPPAEFAKTDPVQLLDQGYAALTAEFAARQPTDGSKTFYQPDQTVGFWIRRMTQETVIHRIDAELACRALVAPVADDLADDGIDELLTIFLGYAFGEWPEDFTEALQGSPGYAYAIRTNRTPTSPAVSWLVKTSPEDISVIGGPDETVDDKVTPAVTVSGTPTAVLRWAWNRDLEMAPGQASAVLVTGQAEALVELRHCLEVGTQ